jgi:transcriptional regulator with XRE-family HTH domain
MRIRSVADLGAAIREQRAKLGMDQATLAKASGTSRKWLVEAERGKARAEIGLILRTLKALGMGVELGVSESAKAPKRVPQASAINNMLASLKKRP